MTYSSSFDLVDLLNNFGSEGFIVGFANKFFTLWSYQIVEDLENHQLALNAYFVHNLGAKNPYDETVPFCASLKGKEMHITQSAEQKKSLLIQRQEFKAQHFSKYPCFKEEIAACQDASLLCWKFNHSAVDWSKDSQVAELEMINIKNQAIRLGCIVRWERLYQNEPATHFSKMPRKGELISECEDADMLCWKYNNRAINNYRIPEEEQALELENIKNRAMELGSVEVAGKIYSPNQQQETWFKQAIEINNAITTCAPFVVTANSNINTQGFITFGFTSFTFANIKIVPATYYGPEYAMPIDMKGKAKRIKGKTLKITAYELCSADEQHNTPYYKITDWQIVK